MRKTLALALVLAAHAALAQSYLYPVPWPKAGGAMLVAVPLADSKVSVYRMVGAPHLSAFNRPFPTTAPELSLPNAPRDQPIVLWAPDLASAANADEDDIFLVVSDHRLVVSIADDERSQPGSPDRIFFMPADNGTLRGRTFYSGANGGDPGERLRIVNLGTQPSVSQVYGWMSGAWSLLTTVTVPPGTDFAYDPPNPQSPYKVTTAEDSVVVVGYMVDNASAPAVDTTTGLPIGTELFGYGTAWHLRAVTALTYVVETRASGSTNWTQIASGSLAADQGQGGQLPGYSVDAWIRIKLGGGTGWATTGTPSLLTLSEWDGFYLPAQQATYCTVGQKFFTNSSARTITMLPRPGTTVTSYDADSGVVTDSYTSVGAWEFHNAFHNAPVRVEVVNGPGSVLMVGTLNWGGCNEATSPGNCGILEGGYSLAGLSSFRCGSDFTSAQCQLSAEASCNPLPPPPPPTPDGGTADAGEEADAGLEPPDAGTALPPPPLPAGVDAGAHDAGMSTPATGGGDTITSGTGCHCASGVNGLALEALGLGLFFFNLRRRKR